MRLAILMALLLLVAAVADAGPPVPRFPDPPVPRFTDASVTPAGRDRAAKPAVAGYRRQCSGGTCVTVPIHAGSPAGSVFRRWR